MIVVEVSTGKRLKSLVLPVEAHDFKSLNKIQDEEVFEFGIDSRYSSIEEKEGDAIALMEARLNRMKNLSKEEIIRAKLLQLKYKMEESLSNSNKNQNQTFSQYLAIYVDVLYTRRNDFASDLGVSPVILSQVINSHREPGKEFILRLMIHSEKVYQRVGKFNHEIWYQIFLNEKLRITMEAEASWRSELGAEVKMPEFIL